MQTRVVSAQIITAWYNRGKNEEEGYTR